MSDDSIYLSILKFGKAKGIIGVTYEEFYDHLHVQGHISQVEIDFFIQTGNKQDGNLKDKWLMISRLF